MTESEWHEYMQGWSLYQDCGLPEGACTSDAQRRGHRAAQAAERSVIADEAREYERREIARELGR